MCQSFFSGKAFALSIQECIDTALKHHPDLKAAESTIASKQAAIKQANSDTKPQINIGSAYARAGGSGVSDNGTYNTSVQAEQLVYDFGRTRLKVKSARASKAAAQADYLTAREKIISNIRSAYYSLNHYIRQNSVAKTRHDNYAKRLDWAMSYYEAGAKAKIEVTQAKADLANSKLKLVKTESAIAQYKAELASAMGQPLLNIDAVDDMLAYKAYEITMEDAVDYAVANRPELLAQQKNVQYAQLNLDYQKKGLAASVTAGVEYGFSGSAPFDERDWTASLSLSIPLWDGGLTQGKIEGAAAELNTAAAEFDSLKNSVILEVRKAWQAVYESKEALWASLESEHLAKETLDLAEGRYKAGVGDSLEISDAVESYAAAQSETVTALYNYKHSQLELEKAMGGLFNEIHP